MPNIDISISADLQQAFDLPSCSDLKLPPPRTLSVSLPGGAKFTAFSDLSKGIPTDCALTFSLLMQIAPFLASIECLVKVLKFVQTAVGIIQSVTDPLKVLTALLDIAKAAKPVIDCALSFTPAGLLLVIRDLLCLIITVLNCFLGQMKSIITILEGISVQIDGATKSGNDELLQTLMCARGNAMTQAAHLTASLVPVGAILELSSDLMKLAQVPVVPFPAIGAATDLDGLKQVIQTMQGFVTTLQNAIDALGVGGCQ